MTNNKFYRKEKNGWIYLYLKGNPYEIGYNNACLTYKEYVNSIKMIQHILPHDYGLEYDFVCELIGNMYEDTIKNNYNEYYQEILGITDGLNSKGVKSNINNVIMWNCFYSIDSILSNLDMVFKGDSKLSINLKNKFDTFLKKHNYFNNLKFVNKVSDKCTAFMAVGDYTKDGKIVCAHNTFDNFIQGQACNIISYVKPVNGAGILMQTLPCTIASSTDFYVNSKGFICTETTIGGFNKFILGDPICCRIRKAVQYADSLDDYHDILKFNNGGDYANSWLIGDTNTNTIMRIELGLHYIKKEKLTNGYFIGYNAATDGRIRNLECKDSGYDDIRRHQGARRVRLTQLMNIHKGRLDINIAKKILADHYDVYLNKINPSSRTCCSHYELDKREFMSSQGRPLPFQPRGAMDGIVCDTKHAKDMSFIARWGTSCGTPFISSEFLEKNSIWSSQKEFLKDRVKQPWTLFKSVFNTDETKRNKKTKKKKNSNDTRSKTKKNI